MNQPLTDMFVVQFWSVYVPCGSQYLDAVKQTLEQIDLIKRMIQRHSDYLRLAVDARGNFLQFHIFLTHNTSVCLNCCSFSPYLITWQYLGEEEGPPKIFKCRP